MLSDLPGSRLSPGMITHNNHFLTLELRSRHSPEPRVSRPGGQQGRSQLRRPLLSARVPVPTPFASPVALAARQSLMTRQAMVGVVWL